MLKIFIQLLIDHKRYAGNRWHTEDRYHYFINNDHSELKGHATLNWQ